jgi:hypothetical protein
VSFSYDVTRKLRYGSENVLAVRVTCPWIPKGRGFLEYMKGDWTTIDPVDQPHIEHPPFFLGPYWDAVPADGNAAFPMGLWRDVRLVSSGSTVIDDFCVATKSINTDGSATLALSGVITNYGDRDVNVRLRLKIGPENFGGDSIFLPERELTLRPGENHISQETILKNAKLWWTWDLGEPNLYRLNGSIFSTTERGSDTRELVFGIRSIDVKTDMSYWLNGRRLFLKGAWYPMSDYYGSKPTRETFLQDLQLFRAANLNHLVAFTVVEKPDFYDLCDRLGILDTVVASQITLSQQARAHNLEKITPFADARTIDQLSQHLSTEQYCENLLAALVGRGDSHLPTIKTTLGPEADKYQKIYDEW